jgi:hypothetical protein
MRVIRGLILFAQVLCTVSFFLQSSPEKNKQQDFDRAKENEGA